MKHWRVVFVLLSMLVIVGALASAQVMPQEDYWTPGQCCHYGIDCSGYNDICCWTGNPCMSVPNMYRCVQDPKDCK